MVGGGKAKHPFFTIGVTTYNRRELLRQTLASILAQTFADFEVIVGNDYPDEVLSGAQFGVSDPRIRFVNHPRNLQEVGNMNALLAMASGRYFTWMADDDLYEPDYLRIAHDTLEEAEFPSAFYSTYRVVLGTDIPPFQAAPRSSVRAFSGLGFLDAYFSGGLKIIPAYGLFDIVTLRSVVGGFEELCASAVGLYGEYFFVVRCGLLREIVYRNAPLVIYRVHAGSWGESNVELAKYREAGRELVRRSGEVLRHPSLSGERNKYLLAVCRIYVRGYSVKLATAHVSRGTLDIGAIQGLIEKIFSEAGSAHRSFVQAGGADGWLPSMVFAWFRCKYSLFAIRILVMSWLRNHRTRMAGQP